MQALWDVSQAGCNRLMDIRKRMIEFGDCISVWRDKEPLGQAPVEQWPHLASKIIDSLVKDIWWEGRWTGQYVVKAWEDFLGRHRLDTWITSYANRVRSLIPDLWEALRGLQACVQALDALASVEWTGTRTGEHQGSIGKAVKFQAGGAVPFSDVLGISLGEGVEVTKGETLQRGGEGSYKFTLRPLLVPLIELARWFASNLDPYDVPEVAEVQATYLSGGYSRQTYDCLMKVLGAPEELWDGVLWGKRQTLTAPEYVLAFLRGLISEQDLNDQLQQTGWLDQRDKKLLTGLADYVPGPGDLIRFMLRDIEDPNIVNEFQLSAEFGDKYKDRLKKWAHSQGISDETMLAFWQAHWRTIGLGQAYTMLHRLREKDANGNPNPLWTKVEHVRNLIAQDDVPKFWRDRLIAISYNVLTRVDVRRMRNLGILTTAQVSESYQDQGYTKVDADRLAKFTDNLRRLFLMSLPSAKRYVAMKGNRRVVFRDLARHNATEVEIEEILQELGELQNMTVRNICTASYRSRYLLGEWDRDALIGVLNRAGIEAETATSLATAWDCQKAARSKQVPATLLCKWYVDSLLTRDEFIVRLVRLGYSRMDALRIVTKCETDQQKRLAERAKRDAKQLASDLEKAQRKEDAAKAKAEALAAREERRRNKAEAERLKRLKKLRKAAREMANITGYTEEEESMRLQNQIQRLMDLRAFTQREAEDVVLDAVDEWKEAQDEHFQAAVDRLADAEEELDQEADESDQAPTEPSQ